MVGSFFLEFTQTNDIDVYFEFYMDVETVLDLFYWIKVRPTLVAQWGNDYFCSWAPEEDKNRGPI